jgi:hypothetical protein
MSKFGKLFFSRQVLRSLRLMLAFQGPSAAFTPTIESVALPASKGPMPGAGRA